MSKYRILKYIDSMLGTDVTILTNKNAAQRGFEAGKVYKGNILEKKDFLTGYPVFKNEIGMLAIDCECSVVEGI